jgi:hypothetical protein|tara:strand:- start:439 stop:669 length:231 start_codon:yes stop_codon:yes gene_type:complete
MARKFKKVKKTKGGTPLKYVSYSSNPKAREAEIKRTQKLYRSGRLTPSMMDKISDSRAEDGKKKGKTNKKKKKKKS